MAQCVMIRVQPQFIDDHAVGAGILAGPQSCSCGGTHRRVDNIVVEADTRGRKAIDVRGDGFFVARVATRFIAQLVGDNHHHIGPLNLSERQCRRTDQRQKNE